MEPYNPFLLTDAGSVFVLEAEAGQQPLAQTKIDDWLQFGLPLPDWAVKRYGDHGSTCPFRRVDGFGEIAVNLPCHTSPAPRRRPSMSFRNRWRIEGTLTTSWSPFMSATEDSLARRTETARDAGRHRERRR